MQFHSCRLNGREVSGLYVGILAGSELGHTWFRHYMLNAKQKTTDLRVNKTGVESNENELAQIYHHRMFIRLAHRM